MESAGGIGQPFDGIVLIDKPPARTSHDVVARCRKIFRTKKVGHAGTLDPDATGLLVVGVGRATRLLRFIQGADKVYRAEITFGVKTDTQDASGSVLARHEMPITGEQLSAVVPKFTGTISQVPPMVSAIKVSGEALYKKARRGETVERRARLLQIHSLRVEQFSPGPFPVAVLYAHVSTGTYMRSLAEDLGTALGGVAHLSSLRRLRVGAFDLSDAVDLETLSDLAATGRLGGALIPLRSALPHLTQVSVSEEVARAALHGAVFPPATLGLREVDAPVAVTGPGGELIAVYGPHKGGAKPLCVVGRVSEEARPGAGRGRQGTVAAKAEPWS